MARRTEDGALRFGTCSNCRGQGCSDCAGRYIHDKCSCICQGTGLDLDAILALADTAGHAPSPLLSDTDALTAATADLLQWDPAWENVALAKRLDSTDQAVLTRAAVHAARTALETPLR